MCDSTLITLCDTGNICGPGDSPRNISSSGEAEFNKTGTHMYCMRLENYIWTHIPYYHKLYIQPDSVLDLKQTKHDLPRTAPRYFFLFWDLYILKFIRRCVG
jgi:hypothetical protein